VLWLLLLPLSLLVVPAPSPLLLLRWWRLLSVPACVLVVLSLSAVRLAPMPSFCLLLLPCLVALRVSLCSLSVLPLVLVSGLALPCLPSVLLLPLVPVFFGLLVVPCPSLFVPACCSAPAPLLSVLPPLFSSLLLLLPPVLCLWLVLLSLPVFLFSPFPLVLSVLPSPRVAVLVPGFRRLWLVRRAGGGFLPPLSRPFFRPSRRFLPL
jgi:hypothetical protein